MCAACSQFVFVQGTITEDQTLASHHIYPLPATTEEGLLPLFRISLLQIHMYLSIILNVFVFPDEWLRPIMRKDNHILVHWGMHPDR